MAERPRVEEEKVFNRGSEMAVHPVIKPSVYVIVAEQRVDPLIPEVPLALKPVLARTVPVTVRFAADIDAEVLPCAPVPMSITPADPREMPVSPFQDTTCPEDTFKPAVKLGADVLKVGPPEKVSAPLRVGVPVKVPLRAAPAIVPAVSVPERVRAVAESEPAVLPADPVPMSITPADPREMLVSPFQDTTCPEDMPKPAVLLIPESTRSSLELKLPKSPGVSDPVVICTLYPVAGGFVVSDAVR